MSDDIVTRLRQEWAECNTCWAGNEAADEIERLRELIAHLQSETWKMCNPNDPCEMCKE